MHNIKFLLCRSVKCERHIIQARRGMLHLELKYLLSHPTFETVVHFLLAGNQELDLN